MGQSRGSRSKGPKCQKPRQGWDSWWGGSKPSPHQLEGRWSFTVLATEKGLSYKQKVWISEWLKYHFIKWAPMQVLSGKRVTWVLYTCFRWVSWQICLTSTHTSLSSHSSPLTPSITPSVFHSRLKTHHKSFPIQFSLFAFLFLVCTASTQLKQQFCEVKKRGMKKSGKTSRGNW